MLLSDFFSGVVNWYYYHSPKINLKQKILRHNRWDHLINQCLKEEDNFSRIQKVMKLLFLLDQKLNEIFTSWGSANKSIYKQRPNKWLYLCKRNFACAFLYGKYSVLSAYPGSEFFSPQFCHLFRLHRISVSEFLSIAFLLSSL